jgi:hypothetical protein
VCLLGVVVVVVVVVVIYHVYSYVLSMGVLLEILYIRRRFDHCNNKYRSFFMKCPGVAQ